MDLQRRLYVLTMLIRFVLGGGVVGFWIPGRLEVPFVVGPAADDDVLAIRDQDGEHFLYDPPPEHILETGTTLIVLGPADSVQKVRGAC